MVAKNLNLLSRIVTILIRVLIFIPGFYSAGALSDSGLMYRQPSFFWYLYGIQGVWGILCLMPYPNFLFSKKVKFFFLAVILICSVHEIWRFWMPSSYSSSQLKNYPQYVKDFNEAKQYPTNNGFYTDQNEKGVILWSVQKPDYYEIGDLFLLTAFSFGPIALFFIRNYQIRRGFTWKEAINRITAR
jgi:hypothetical protein